LKGQATFFKKQPVPILLFYFGKEGWFKLTEGMISGS